MTSEISAFPDLSQSVHIWHDDLQLVMRLEDICIVTWEDYHRQANNLVGKCGAVRRRGPLYPP